MAPSINTGVVDPSDRLASEIKQGTSDYLHLVDLDETPFFSILRALPSAAAVQTQVTWDDRQNRPLLASLAGSAASADTTIGVGSGEGDYFNVGDLAVLFSGGGSRSETLQVTGVTGDNVGVLRSVGGVAAASASSGSQVMILGPAVAQGADIPVPVWVTAASGFNYTEIFRHPVIVTGSDAQSQRFGSKRKNRDIAFALAAHYRQIEQTALFGGRSYTSDNGDGLPLGTMGGLAEFVAASPINGALSATGFSDLLDEPFAVGSKSKVIFAGARAAAGLQAVYGTNFLPNSNDRKRWGIRPDWFVNTPYGLIPGFTKGEWAANYNVAAVNTGPSQSLFVVDTKHVKYRPLRDTSLVKGRSEPGVDTDAQEWLTEASIEVSNAAAHLFVTGITS